jgi:hypothetical protein
VDAVRRADDGELCGFVEDREGRWCARTVFGALLGDHADRDGAVEQVRREGLASLAERWTLRNRETGAEEIVCIQEANETVVTVALGYYSLPGVPTRTFTVGELGAGGAWELRR